jgi:hypothetical protein
VITILYSAVTILHLSVSQHHSINTLNTPVLFRDLRWKHSYKTWRTNSMDYVILFISEAWSLCIYPPIIRLTLGIPRFYYILYRYSKFNQIVARRKMLTEMWQKFLRLRFPTQRNKTVPESGNSCVLGGPAQVKCRTIRNLSIHVVNYMRIYKGVQLKSKIQHTGNWSATAWHPLPRATCVIAQQYFSITLVSLF